MTEDAAAQAEAVKAEPAIQQTEGEDEELEEEGLPFPNARVVALMRQNMKGEHQISKEVKIAVNRFLYGILKDTAEKMDAEPYFTMREDHFNRAVRKYREVDLYEKKMITFKRLLEKQKAELEEKIMELEHAMQQ